MTADMFCHSNVHAPPPVAYIQGMASLWPKASSLFHRLPEVWKTRRGDCGRRRVVESCILPDYQRLIEFVQIATGVFHDRELGDARHANLYLAKLARALSGPLPSVV